MLHMRRVVSVLMLAAILLPAFAQSSPHQPSPNQTPPQQKQSKPKCTDTGTYLNSAGETVKRPENCSAPPQGATAQCRDGAYSFSRSRRGSCSHHGGVAKWL